MLWSTHRRIAGKIANELKLTFQEGDCLEKGSLTPDYWKDYPHHYGKGHQIRKRIVEARRLFINDQKLDSIFSLGIALHYLQDSWVTVSGSDVRHGWWEELIDESPFVNDILEMINELGLSHLHDTWRGLIAGTQNAKKEYIQIVKQLHEFHRLCRSNFEGYDGTFVETMTLNIATLERPEPGTPVFDLNFAYRISLLVALSVFTSKTSSIFLAKLKQIKKEFEVRLKDAEEDLARKLVELNYVSTDLQRNGGFINWLKRLICRLRLWFNYRRYEKRSHLLKVQSAYYKKANRESRAFSNWYQVIIPELNIGQVERLFV